MRTKSVRIPIRSGRKNRIRSVYKATRFITDKEKRQEKRATIAKSMVVSKLNDVFSTIIRQSLKSLVPMEFLDLENEEVRQKMIETLKSQYPTVYEKLTIEFDIVKKEPAQ